MKFLTENELHRYLPTAEFILNGSRSKISSASELKYNSKSDFTTRFYDGMFILNDETGNTLQQLKHFSVHWNGLSFIIGFKFNLF